MTVSEAKHMVHLQEWSQMIKARQESGLTVKAWCAQNDIALQTYYRRLRSVRKDMLEQKSITEDTSQDETMPSLVKVNIPPEPQRPSQVPEPPANTNFRLQCNGAILDIPVGTGAEAIAEVLKAMGQYAI